MSSEDLKSDEIDIKSVVSSLIENKKLFFFASIFSLIISSVSYFFYDDFYESSSVLYTTNSESSSMNSSSFDRLADIGGFNLNLSQMDNQASYCLKLFDSIDFFIEVLEPDLLKDLIGTRKAKTLWSNLEDNLNSKNIFLAHDRFKKKFQVDFDEDYNTFDLEYTSSSPGLSQTTLQKIIYTANSKIREKDLEEARKKLEFVRTKLSTENLSQIKEVLSTLAAESYGVIALAESREEYYLKTIQKPYFNPLSQKIGFFLFISISLLLFNTVVFLYTLFFRIIDK